MKEIVAIALRGRDLVDPQILRRALQGHGRILVGADEDQLELRNAALLGNDQFLLALFARGEDPHAAFARSVFPDHFPQFEMELAKHGWKGKTDLNDIAGAELIQRGMTKAQLPEEFDGRLALLDEVTRARFKRVAGIQQQWGKLRDLVKRLEYLRIYLGEAERAYETLVKDFPEVTYKNIVDAIKIIDAKMTGVMAYNERIQNDAALKREIREALIGRVRLFPMGNFSPNVVANFPNQALSASLIGMAILRFIALTQPSLLQLGELYQLSLLDARWVSERKREGYDQWRAPVELVNQVHDSVVAECDEEDGEKCATLLTMAMTQEVTLGPAKMRYTAKAKIARRWSEV